MLFFVSTIAYKNSILFSHVIAILFFASLLFSLSSQKTAQQTEQNNRQHNRTKTDSTTDRLPSSTLIQSLPPAHSRTVGEDRTVGASRTHAHAWNQPTDQRPRPGNPGPGNFPSPILHQKPGAWPSDLELILSQDYRNSWIQFWNYFIGWYLPWNYF